jgi:pimeloyl-ACP methyl ester carboxylesterase
VLANEPAMPDTKSNFEPLAPAVRDLFPFELRSMDVGGLRYAYVDEGSGDPLLMVHGNPTWGFYFRNFIKNLSANHRCIAVDHIGCGLSEKPQNYRYRLARHIANLEHFVLEKDLRNITLMVHDWGGAIGLGVAVRHPDRFKKLIISNTAAFRSQRIPKILKLCRVPGLGDLAILGFNAFLRIAVKTALVHKERLSGAVLAGYFAPYNSWANRIATLRFVQDIPMDPEHPSYSALTEVENNLFRLRHLPTLLMWGEKDWCFSPWFRDRFLDFFPDAQRLDLAQAGHFLYEDAPEQTLEAVRSFIQ